MLLYRILIHLAALAVIVPVALRALVDSAARGFLSERLGGGAFLTDAPRIWLHGASNGELTAARPLIVALLKARPGLQVAVTVNTVTARQMVSDWAIADVTGRLAPLDVPIAVRRCLARLRPAALVVIENELWPERVTRTAARGIPVIVASARMSLRSARSWRRFAVPLGVAGAVLGALTRVYPQDQGSADRLRALGLAAERFGPLLNLKASAAVPAPRREPALAFARDDTVLAASTHDGEERIVLDAFCIAQSRRPGLRLILAPRHPRRRDAIEELIRARGLTFATRSRGQDPQAETSVYLADTMGEMALWYASASVTFVGGSLADRGGHTPFEPAAAGSAILHGPDVANFAAPYAALAHGAALCVGGPEDLADAMQRLPGSAEASHMAKAAMLALAELAPDGDLAPLLVEIASILDRHHETPPARQRPAQSADA